MKILNFFDFIFENFKRIEVPFQFCGDFDLVLKKIDSPISKSFFELRLKESDISLINIGEQNDTASFTTSTKLSRHFKTEDEKSLSTFIKPLIYNTEIYNKDRTSIKIGRLIRKLFGTKFSDSQIENFVNQYKSILDSKITNFELWEGQKIQEGYKSRNYTFEGSSSNPLMNSCMNDEHTLIEFYRYVPVSLLVLLNKDGHIQGRALVWQTDKGLFMDRVYTAFDTDYYKFINWAKKNNVIYKSENKSGCLTSYVKDNTISWFKMSVELKFEIEKYNQDDFTEYPNDFPYMDTFIYGQKNKLSNYEPLDGRYYILTETDGTYVEIDPQFDIYGERIDNDELDNYEWSNTQKGWIHKRSGTYVISALDFLSYDYLKDPKNGFTLSDKNDWIKIEK